MAAFSEATVRAAYEACHNNGVAQGTVGIVSTLAIFFMIYKMLDIWTKNSKNDNFNMKMYFDLIRQYAMYAAFIAAFPFILRGIETTFANMQDSISSKYSSSLNQSTLQAAADFVKNYQEESAKTDDSYSGDSNPLDRMKDAVDSMNPITIALTYFKDMWAGFVTAFYIACLWVLKYVYFFFCAGRYLWLLMLEVLAPIALICTLNPKTSHYFTTWIKNMAVCYLLIPFFLMADAFSETLASQLSASFDLSTYGALWVLAIIVIKISMFGVVSKKAHSLI